MMDGGFLPARVELYCDVVDLRKGQHGLVGLVEQVLEREGIDGTLYLFSNRSRTLLKGFFWDRTGYVVLSKRLEGSRFSIPTSGGTITLDKQRLRLLLDGLKLFS